MLPGTAAHIALFLGVMGLLLLAGWRDVATRTLPDGVALALAATGAALQLLQGDLGGTLLAAGLVFLGAALIWRLGALGGGDVKLLAACALLAGTTAIPTMLAATALSGGVLSLLYLLGRRWAPSAPARRTAAGRVLRAELWRMRRGGPLPYGLAIGAGTLFSLAERT